MRNRGKQCFLFDLDGTLIDSSALHETAFRAVLGRHAPELSTAFDYEAAKGKATAEVFAGLGVTGTERIAALTQEKQSEYRRRVASELKAFTNAAGLLRHLRDEGRRLFAVTGSSSGSARRGLEATGLIDYFEGIVTADDVSAHKPDPEPFLHCLRTYGLAPEACVVVEDAASGVASAQAAGLDVLGVHNPLLEAFEIRVFPDLYELGREFGQQTEAARA